MTTATQPDQPGQRSAGLTLSLSSNNPFRNRAASPSSLPDTPASPFDDPPPRPVSRNPFLDPVTNQPITSPRMASPQLTSPAAASPEADKQSPTPEQLFDTLNIDDSKESKPAPPPPGPGQRGPMRRPGPPRGENVPPPGRRPPPHHRPSQSQEEAQRRRMMPGGRPFEPSSPQKRMDRRTRRNSESSLADDKGRPLTDEEAKERDARRRDRERRRHEAKPRPSRRMDIIDQLDATGIFGTGMFHHDGPFDALNPHRNKKGSARAPMQAFPKDSLNNMLGGSGPLNKRPDHATFMGTSGEEAFKEYSSAEKMGSSSGPLPPVFDPLSRGSILHGDESMGLGTSTFLEGTPAARTVIQRRQEEDAADTIENGLQRKKSLAQRIRSINRPGPNSRFGPMTNPDGVYASRRSPPIPGAPTSSSVQSAKGERNPFFAEYDGQEEKLNYRAGAASPTSPAPGSLERRATTDATSTPDEQVPKPGGGLLARVKSLKGGRRPRQNGPAPAGAPAPAPAIRDDLNSAPAPGTAA